MPKIRNIILLLLVAFIFWHFYGETFNRSGVTGVYEEIRSDVIEIKDNPKVIATIDVLKQEIQLLYDKLTENEPNEEQPKVEKPDLDAPSTQSFSIHNIELGDSRAEVEQQSGKPQRSSLNEYGVDWVTYHEHYQNFFMVAYDEEDTVVGLYTNQDLLSSTKGIGFDSSRDAVLQALNEPIKNIRKGLVIYQLQTEQANDTFLIDNNYVTIFYDEHENNTVTAIQIISGDLEKQKKEYFADASDQLREGFEYQLFDLTNAARVNHGLPILTWDEDVRQTAQDHSMDMAVNNYFGHTNLEGKSPFDRMSEDGISYRMAAENLAAGQPSSIFAHEGLMNSLGHRENILQAELQALAVGVAFNDENQPYYTENFLSK